MKPRSFIRTVKPDFFFDGTVKGLDHTTRLFMIGLICQSDDYGRFYAEAGHLRSVIFPEDKKVTDKDIEHMKKILSEEGVVRLYGLSGSFFGYFINWEKHQSIRKPKDSIIPAPTSTCGDESDETLPLFGNERTFSELKTPVEREMERDRILRIPSEMWKVWREVFEGDLGRPYKLTDTRRKQLLALHDEQLHDADDPIAFFRKICLVVKADEFYAGSIQFCVPESLFRNEGRRERHARAGEAFKGEAGSGEWAKDEAERILGRNAE